MNWSINGKTVKSLMKDGKEIIKVERVEDGKVLYEKKQNNYFVATIAGYNVTLGYGENQWLNTNGNVIIDWGDGTTDTVNNPSTALTHRYSDGESEHSIVFLGTVTSLGMNCFDGCTDLTSIVIPSGVTSLGVGCFYGCTGLTSVVISSSVTSLENNCFDNCRSLTSVTIPNSVTSLGINCFYRCNNLIDYQLYWTGNDIITYNGSKMPNNTNSIFTVPEGEIQNYINKGYPMLKLQERIITNDGIIYRKPITATFTGDVIQLGMDREYWFMPANNIVINWGDGTSNTVIPRTSSYHIYTDGKSEHTIMLIGGITSIGYGFVDESHTNLTSITIPNNIESLGEFCFQRCTSLTSIVIPNSVISLGDYCFDKCTNLIDYQLYWTSNDIITYNSAKMPNNTNTTFTIPVGETANYVAKGYPSNKLIERSS